MEKNSLYADFKQKQEEYKKKTGMTHQLQL